MQKSVILALVLLAVVGSVVEGGGGRGRGKHMKCKGETMKWESNKDVFMACKEKMPWGKKNGGGGGEKDRMCGLADFVDCIWEKLHIVKGNKIENKALEKLFEDLYPGEVGHGLGKLIVKECVNEENTKDLSDPDKCKAFKPILMCLLKHKSEYCGEPEAGAPKGDEDEV